MDKKTCVKCGKEKPSSCFYKSKKSKDGLRYQCKKCGSEYSRLYRKGYRVNSNKIDCSVLSWKPIPGYDGYHVNVDGQIVGPIGKIMKPMSHRSGHLYVLCNRGKGKQHKLYIHRAMLLAFVGLPLPGQETRHLDGKPQNNNLENLRWGTSKENSQDARRHGTLPKAHETKDTKLVPEDIPKIFECYRQGSSSRKIATQFGTSHTTIQKILRGERWKGYRYG